MNICMCGAQASYPHHVDCPFPLFKGSAEREAAWTEQRDARKEARDDARVWAAVKDTLAMDVRLESLARAIEDKHA